MISIYWIVRLKGEWTGDFKDLPFEFSSKEKAESWFYRKFELTDTKEPMIPSFVIKVIEFPL